MTKKRLAVDVEKSLWHKTNGRLKPAKKSEYAGTSGKSFECEVCHQIFIESTASFSEVLQCEKCGGRLLEVLE